jgi:hypothetical protein
MIIKCNNEGCTYQYGGDCTAMENIRLTPDPAGAADMTLCSACSAEYEGREWEIKSFSERAVFCGRKDCRYHAGDTLGKCKRNGKGIRLAGGMEESIVKCICYERRTSGKEECES